MIHIFIMSDGTGQTAEQALQAALTQFSETQVKIERYPEVRTEKQVRQVVEQAAQCGGFIVHTVVSTRLRNLILETGRLHNVEAIDLMGPLLAQLTQQFENSPSEKPGLFRELNKAYFQRIEAMEFVLRHDDGQRLHELDKAEIVLVGVSRTFKTPLSMFLAFKGWMVANIPIILQLPPPENLFKLSPYRVFGLTTNANHLARLRRVRHMHLGGATGEYANIHYITQELRYAQKIFNEHPDWAVIDVTQKPIEEIASQILKIIRQRKDKNKTDNISL